MRAARLLSAALSMLSAACLGGCGPFPGQPPPGIEVQRPEAEHSATVLYGQNCSGCHGVGGKWGAAANIGDPEFQAWIDDASLRNTSAYGVKGSLMPAFVKSAGGELTDSQIDALVRGMRRQWYKGNVLAGQDPPPWTPDGPSDPSRGEAAYNTYCARCHGAPGGNAGSAGSVLGGSFLALMPAQALRAAVVIGRSDLGMPDWRNDLPGHPMSHAEVNDVVAWMTALAPVRPGQVHPVPYTEVGPKRPQAKPESRPALLPGIKGREQ